MTIEAPTAGKSVLALPSLAPSVVTASPAEGGEALSAAFADLFRQLSGVGGQAPVAGAPGNEPPGSATPGNALPPTDGKPLPDLPQNPETRTLLPPETLTDPDEGEDPLLPAGATDKLAQDGDLAATQTTDVTTALPGMPVTTAGAAIEPLAPATNPAAPDTPSPMATTASTLAAAQPVTQSPLQLSNDEASVEPTMLLSALSQLAQPKEPVTAADLATIPSLAAAMPVADEGTASDSKTEARTSPPSPASAPALPAVSVALGPIFAVAGQPTASPASTPSGPFVAAMAEPVRHEFAELVDRLSEARELSRPGRAEMQLAHRDFGQVSLRFDLDGQSLKVAMSSAHGGFVAAAQAALAETARADAPRADVAPPRVEPPLPASTQAGAPAMQADAQRQGQHESANHRRPLLADNPPRQPDTADTASAASQHRSGLFA